MANYPYRLKLWHNILEDLGPPEGCILPPWLVAVYCLIFPLNGLHWLLLERNGPYDIFRMVWTIHGVQYSDQLFRQITFAEGAWYKFELVNGVHHVTRRLDDA